MRAGIILFKTEKEMRDVINALSDLMNKYGYVTRADYYDLCGVRSVFKDHEVGWTNLDDIETHLEGDGTYALIMPECKKLY